MLAYVEFFFTFVAGSREITEISSQKTTQKTIQKSAPKDAFYCFLALMLCIVFSTAHLPQIFVHRGAAACLVFLGLEINLVLTDLHQVAAAGIDHRANLCKPLAGA